MPASRIFVIPGHAPTHELPRIEVRTYASPADPSATISSVQFLEQESEISVKATTLLHRKALSYDEAVEFAKQTAVELGLTHIYARFVPETEPEVSIGK